MPFLTKIDLHRSGRGGQTSLGLFSKPGPSGSPHGTDRKSALRPQGLRVVSQAFPFRSSMSHLWGLTGRHVLSHARGSTSVRGSVGHPGVVLLHALVSVHQPRVITRARNLAPSPHTSILHTALLILLSLSLVTPHCLQGRALLGEASQVSSTPSHIWASDKVTFIQVPSLLCLDGFPHPLHCVSAPCLPMLPVLPQGLCCLSLIPTLSVPSSPSTEPV